ncbi:TPA: response regulator transcription factor [Streptococcus suis]|uniref:response regulator transcription factor n=1 Tax=Streptococcus suis TaxID=1307 RepID=UPI002A7CFA6F|nr:response regulator transcription factor [Streptococcus suis]HEM3932028.1 response regulator transcription factor [Streptococcus suis]HEM3946008.1 response regulator transcription factor [Streptococcus suis]HEM3960010.1 response regulator transcription factor [Streptococcus suis]
MTRILIAEDDVEIAYLERDYLEMQGYQVDLVHDGGLVEDQLKKEDYALLMLDVMLPNKTGYDLCRDLRDKVDFPILMVTSKQETMDVVRGLGLGADDYISKPFDPMELVARVKAHLARYQRFQKDNDQNELTVGNMTIFLDNWKVTLDGQEIKLPNREFELLVYLAKHSNRVFSKEHLFEKIWGYDYVGDSATVAVHVNRLRDKLGSDLIETVWGAGYRLND